MIWSPTESHFCIPFKSAMQNSWYDQYAFMGAFLLFNHLNWLRTHCIWCGFPWSCKLQSSRQSRTKSKISLFRWLKTRNVPLITWCMSHFIDTIIHLVCKIYEIVTSTNANSLPYISFNLSLGIVYEFSMNRVCCVCFVP